MKERDHLLFMAILLTRANISDGELHFVDGRPEDPFQLSVSLMDSRETLAGDKDQGMDVLFELRKPFVCLIIEIGDVVKHSRLEGISGGVGDRISNAQLSSYVSKTECLGNECDFHLKGLPRAVYIRFN